MTKPQVFEYLDVYLYLGDLYKFRKYKEKDFSYSSWADEIGLKSRSYLRAIVLGEKPFHQDLLPMFIESLKLSSAEAEYFILLSQYSSAPNAEIKELIGKSLIHRWKHSIHQVEIVNIAEFLKDSIIPVVFTYLSFDDASSKFEDMINALSCEPLRLQNALRCLVWQKLIDGTVNDDGDVIYKTIEPYFKVPNVAHSNAIKNFHLEGLKLAEQASHSASEKRKFYSSFLAMDENQFLKAQELIQDFNEKIVSIFNSPAIKGKAIYRVNIQAFPVSAPVKK